MQSCDETDNFVYNHCNNIGKKIKHIKETGGKTSITQYSCGLAYKKQNSVSEN